MWTRVWPVTAVLCMAHTASPIAPSEDVTAELQRNTQALLDAITTGTASVWETYLDSAVSFTTEDGVVQRKAEMVGQIKPLPAGISGSIQATEFRVTVHGNVAIATHLDDEHESYFGHQLHCQYRTTDTWLKTPAGWRLIASQIIALRTDPPSVALTRRQMAEYVGRYALTPEISYEIRQEGDRLVGQRNGRKAETLRAEAPEVLFVPGQPRYRKVFQRDSTGRITGFAERREAWDIVWRRMP
jgi:ketosteroid isomerase-like protein